MSTTELSDLEALLEQALPDPKGYLDRVLGQLLDRLDSGATTVAPTVVGGLEADVHERLEDRNLLLAAALGACECWGEDPTCPVCSGEGSVAWTDPDPVLFEEYVSPAARKLTSPTAPRGAGGPVTRESQTGGVT